MFLICKIFHVKNVFEVLPEQENKRTQWTISQLISYYKLMLLNTVKFHCYGMYIKFKYYKKINNEKCRHLCNNLVILVYLFYNHDQLQI